MHCTRVVASLALLSPAVGFGQPTAQPRRVECHLARQSDESVAGPCVTSADTVARVTLRRPTTVTKDSEVALWRGTATLKWRGGQVEPVALEPRAGGAFRTGTQWFEVLAAEVMPAGLRFALDQERLAPPTDVDLRILRLARSYVRDSSAWSPGVDDQPAMRDPSLGFNCPASSGGARTLFCALHDASVATAGEYWHGRPAVNAVRAAINAAITAAGTPRPRHPLTDFNSAPTTRLGDVQLVFDRAAERIEAQLRDRR